MICNSNSCDAIKELLLNTHTRCALFCISCNAAYFFFFILLNHKFPMWIICCCWRFTHTPLPLSIQPIIFCLFDWICVCCGRMSEYFVCHLWAWGTTLRTLNNFQKSYRYISFVLRINAGVIYSKRVICMRLFCIVRDSGHANIRPNIHKYTAARAWSKRDEQNARESHNFMETRNHNNIFFI